jgi:hypothetical protein
VRHLSLLASLHSVFHSESHQCSYWQYETINANNDRKETDKRVGSVLYGVTNMKRSTNGGIRRQEIEIAEWVPDILYAENRKQNGTKGHNGQTTLSVLMSVIKYMNGI